MNSHHVTSPGRRLLPYDAERARSRGLRRRRLLVLAIVWLIIMVLLYVVSG